MLSDFLGVRDYQKPAGWLLSLLAQNIRNRLAGQKPRFLTKDPNITVVCTSLCSL